MNLGPYAKAINGALVAALAVLVLILPAGVTVGEWITLASTLVVNAAAIYAVANTTKAPYAKAVANAIVTGLGVVAAQLQQGGSIELPLILSAIIAVLNAVVVVPQTPNAEESDRLVVHDISGHNDPQHRTLPEPGVAG